jgi:hypothetical protein
VLARLMTVIGSLGGLTLPDLMARTRICHVPNGAIAKYSVVGLTATGTKVVPAAVASSTYESGAIPAGGAAHMMRTAVSEVWLWRLTGGFGALNSSTLTSTRAAGPLPFSLTPVTDTV